jgi:hypothetical protein
MMHVLFYHRLLRITRIDEDDSELLSSCYFFLWPQILAPSVLVADLRILPVFF